MLIPLVGFLPFDEEGPGINHTIDESLATDDRIVPRYGGEADLPGDGGAFVLCSCWLVDALALSGGSGARDRFATLTEYASPVGPTAEELDPATKTYFGNFPHAFSRIGIINSALYLGHADGHEQPSLPPIGIRLGDPDEVTQSK